MSDSFTRRQFVKSSAGAAVLSSVPFSSALTGAPGNAPPSPARGSGPADPPEAIGQPMPSLQDPLPQPPEERVGFALVGLGSYALNQIAPNIANTRRARLAGLVSGNADKAQRVAQAYGIGEEHVYSYDTFDQIAADDAIDVVHIILPIALHRKWTERAFAAGKHVLCEKPMAGTAEACESMIEAGRQAGKKLMIDYRAQYDPYNLRAIEAMRSGEIGAPRLVTGAHGYRLGSPDQWRAKEELAAGGSLYDIGIYSLNGARYLLGEEPTQVQAHYREGSGRPGITVEEGVEWTAEFPSKAVAHCSSSYVAGANELSVKGTEGDLELDPATSYYVRNLYIESREGRQEVVIPNTNQFAAMLDEMAAAVQEDRAPKTPGEEGLRDVRIMEAIYEAAETGRAVTL